MTPREKGFDGNATGLDLVDLVQLACLEGEKRRLTVGYENEDGAIYFAGSEIVHAECGELTGEEAFYAIMGWTNGTFSLSFDSTDKRTVDASWNFLLMEAVRRVDEQPTVKNESDELLKVLVVDDSRLFTKAFVKLFDEEIGAKVIGTATNGKEALKFLESQEPDLITLDINMPVMGGDVALKHIMIRSPAPVVLVSNFDGQVSSSLMDFMRLGAIDVVAKPTTPKTWEIVSERFQYIVAHAKDFNLDNVRRAKKMVPVTKKNSSVNKIATRLVLFLSGLGGMLELQKIVPAIEYDDETALLIIQNMYPAVTGHLVQHLDNYTRYRTQDLSPSMELFGGCCGLSHYRGEYRIEDDRDIPTVSMTPAKEGNKGLNVEPVLASAAEIYAEALTVVILGGIDFELNRGLQRVAAAEGSIVIQSPDSSLQPGSALFLKEEFPGGNYMRPGEMADFLSKRLHE